MRYRCAGPARPAPQTTGISVNGGGFINTSRAVLTTGTPNFAADGSLSGFNVSRGNISIQGAGLDASAVDQVDLLARAVQVNAAIFAKNLNVVAGANALDHDSLKTTPIAGEGPAPGVMIDVASLGGMYANRIWLVGTENGVGVSTKGVLAAQAGDLILTAEGKLVLAGQTVARGDVHASARDGIESSGTTLAQGNVSVSTAGTLNNRGTLAANGQLSVTAGTVDNRDGTVAADLVTLHAMSLVNRAGRVTQTGTGVATIDVAGSLDNAGGIIATNGALDVRAGNVANRGGTLEGQTDATLSVASLDNSAGGYVGARVVSVASAGTLDNSRGTIEADGTLAVTAQSLANEAGSITNSGAGATSVNAGGALSNTQGGLIAGNGDVSVSGGSVSNAQGTIASAGKTSVRSGDAFDNRAGLVQAAGPVSISAQGAIDNTRGQIEANGATATLAVTGASLDNTDGRVANAGTGATDISATEIVSSNTAGGAGTIGGNGDVTVSVQTLSNLSGAQLVAGHDLTLSIAQLADNTNATLSAANNVTLNGRNAALINAGGSVRGNGVVTVHTASLDNRGGRIGNDAGSGGSIAIVSNSVANGNGAIGSDGDLALTTGRLDGDGSIIAGHDAAVTIGSDYTLTAANRIQANHDLTFTTAGTLTNQGSLIAVNALTVGAANVDNQTGAGFNSANTTIDATGGILNAGRIEGDSVTTHSASLSNLATIIGNAVSLNAGTIANTGPAAAIAAASTVNLFASDIVNTGGANIFSLGDINIARSDARDANGLLSDRAGSVTNDQSTIEATGNIEIATGTLTNTRAAPTVETVTTGVDTVHETKRDKYIACTLTNADSHSSCTQQVWDYGYLNPLKAPFAAADIVSTTDGPNAADRVL